MTFIIYLSDVQSMEKIPLDKRQDYAKVSWMHNCPCYKSNTKKYFSDLCFCCQCRAYNSCDKDVLSFLDYDDKVISREEALNHFIQREVNHESEKLYVG